MSPAGAAVGDTRWRVTVPSMQAADFPAGYDWQNNAGPVFKVTVRVGAVEEYPVLDAARDGVLDFSNRDSANQLITHGTTESSHRCGSVLGVLLLRALPPSSIGCAVHVVASRRSRPA